MIVYRIIVVFKGKKGRNAYTITTCHDELVATHKNEDILTDALGSKEHGGCVRGVGGFVSQSQYFNTVKGKEKMITPQVEICHKEEDDSRCKSDKKRSNRSRSSIESINIDLDADEDTPSNKGVEGTPCQLPIGSINNIVVVAMIIDDNIGCPNVKVLVDVEHSTRKDVVYSSNYTDVNETIKLLNRHVVKNMKDVDMIRIPMNELIFGSDKFVYLAREDLLHYCDMVEIGYMCILFSLDVACYVLDSLRSKVNEDIHGVINRVEDMTSETRSTTLSINSKMKNCKGCGYYVHKYIHEIVHNSSTSITSLFITDIKYATDIKAQSTLQGRTLKVLELNPFLSVHVHFQWFLTPDERSPLIESIGHLLDRFGSHLSSPSNELASRPIPWKNLSGSMPGVWVEFIGVRAPKIERLMTNTKRTPEVFELSLFPSLQVHFHWFLTPDERLPLGRSRKGTAFYPGRRKLSPGHSCSRFLGTNTGSPRAQAISFTASALSLVSDTGRAFTTRWKHWPSFGPFWDEKTKSGAFSHFIGTNTGSPRALPVSFGARESLEIVDTEQASATR
uniref:Uncharacterized protein n=1 Tax=Cucumis melo TaxID=3656 RepID=A0A9I9EM20_CUCME